MSREYDFADLSHTRIAGITHFEDGHRIVSVTKFGTGGQNCGPNLTDQSRTGRNFNRIADQIIAGRKEYDFTSGLFVDCILYGFSVVCLSVSFCSFTDNTNKVFERHIRIHGFTLSEKFTRTVQ